jgi:hypothetical protein
MTDQHPEYHALDPLDEIDQIVEQITDQHIDDRLRETLRRADHAPAQHEDDSTPTEAAFPAWPMPLQPGRTRSAAPSRRAQRARAHSREPPPLGVGARPPRAGRADPTP